MVIFYGGHIVSLKIASRPVCADVKLEWSLGEDGEVESEAGELSDAVGDVEGEGV